MQRQKTGALSHAIKRPQKHRADGNIVHLWYGPKSGARDQPPPPRFDKEAWLTSLTPEQRHLLKLEIETLDESWLAQLKNVITGVDFLNLKRFLERETAAGRKWLPEEKDVYSWSRLTPFDTVKVVIQGSEPSRIAGQSHGLAYSMQPGIPAPPSLKNIFRALENDYPSFQRPPTNGGVLTPWASQGVLLLNTCLTVREGLSYAHVGRGWERFVQHVIDVITRERAQGVVFMAWGAAAKRRLWKVPRGVHLVLESVHPTPLSASFGFFDCGHFKGANEWLAVRYGGGGEVDWALVPGTSTRELREEEPSVDGEDGRVGQKAREDPDDKTTAARALDSFSLFSQLPPEIRHEIYLLATPPRFVHVQERPAPSAETFEKFEAWLHRTLPSQLPIHPSLAYFAFTWRRYVLDPEFQQQLSAPPLHQARLPRYGFSPPAKAHMPPIWTPSPETPSIDPLWLSERPPLAWHLCRRSRLFSQAPIPALLHTCRDARDFLTQHGYALAFATRSAPAHTWFHFTHDILLLRGADWDSPQLHRGVDAPWIVGQFVPEELRRVRRLALTFSNARAVPLDGEEVHHTLRLVPRVEEVFVVNSVLDDAARLPYRGRGTNIQRIIAQDAACGSSDARPLWDSVEFDGADAAAESLAWLGPLRLTAGVLADFNGDGPPASRNLEEIQPLLVRSFERYFDAFRRREAGRWSRPTVKLVNVGTPQLIKLLLRDREAYWQGREGGS